jgi:CRISPR type III-B/RAMP module-associated protein Cmr3
MNRYLLTFKPLKHFFFGNDKTFSEDYFAISSYFPQNTQLLGAIRLFIAEQHSLITVHRNGRYSDNPNALKKLIGDAGKLIKDTEKSTKDIEKSTKDTVSKDFSTNEKLGMIENLSPMFIVSKDLDDAYFPTPFDIEINDKNIRYYTLDSIDDDYFLSDYDVKNSSYQHLGNSSFWQNYIEHKPLNKESVKSFDDIFKKHTQVGIELKNKQTVEEKFYSKIDYTLDKEFLFGAVIELDEDIINDGIIQIGAESSLFELKVKKLEDTKLLTHPIIANLFKEPKEYDKVVAVSDMMLPHTSEIDSYFNLIPFYKNFAMLNKEKSHFKSKTKQQRLIPAGSVFYMKKPQTFKPKGAYKKMGYNQIIGVKNV